MGEEATWKSWERGDIIYGILIPLILGILVLMWPFIMEPLVGPATTMFGGILTVGMFQLIATSVIPLIAGFCWNKWAGGMSGFLMGFLYYLAVMNYYDKHRLQCDVSWQAYVVVAMIGGYMAGSLSKDSFNFIRLLVVGVLIALIQGTILVWTFDIVYPGVFAAFPGANIYPELFPGNPGSAVPYWFYICFTNYTPVVIGAIFGALFSKILSWFALAPRMLKAY